MVDIDKTRTEPIEQFWEITDDIRAGMLGVDGSGQHLQPMHPNCEREGRNIWFFVKQSSDLVQSIGSGAHGHFCVVGRSHDYHACVAGKLTVESNQAMIERFWSSVTAAWFKSKADPDLTLVKLALDNGVAWGSVGSVRFGWEMVKANISDAEPEVGARRHFSFIHQVEDGKAPPASATVGLSDAARSVPGGAGQL